MESTLWSIFLLVILIPVVVVVGCILIPVIMAIAVVFAAFLAWLFSPLYDRTVDWAAKLLVRSTRIKNDEKLDI